MFYPFKDISMGGSFMRLWGYPEIARLSEGSLGSRRRMTKAPDFVESVWETRETPMNRYTIYIYNYNYMYIIYVYIYMYIIYVMYVIYVIYIILIHNSSRAWCSSQCSIPHRET